MDQKTRLLTLSNSLEFPDNVKCIAISDKRLIKEGELREVALDGRMSVLQKLSLRKPNSYYIILFNDMLLVTKRKRNDRYVVLDYCERAAIQADVQHLSDLQNRSLNPQSCNLPQPLSTCPLDSPFGLPNTDPPANSTAVRFSEHRQTTELTGVGEEHEDLYSHQNHTDKRILSRSGSSLSGYRIRTRIKSNIGFNVHQTTSSDQANTKIIHLILTASHNGTFTELNLLPKDRWDLFSIWQ
ncbi:unnamed protein product [Dicrocoelium dendriticum]|nr:unnamed protein product [Dicrocoelium dendriticum]